MATPFSTTPSTVSTPIPRRSLRADERRIGGVVWRRIHQPSIRRTQEPSSAWAHGDKYCNPARPRDPPRFICDYCNTVLKPQANRSTGNYRRHLILKHKIPLTTSCITDEQETASEDEEQEA